MNITDLNEWLNRDNSFYTAVELHVFDDTGRGLRATKDILEGELILSVPSSKILTRNDCLSIIEGVIGKHFSGLKLWSGHKVLTLCLLFWKLNLTNNNAIPFKEYFSTIPSEFNLPFYSLRDNELSNLSYNMWKSILEMREKFSKDYTDIKTFLSDTFAVDFSLENVRWAWSAVNTRILCLTDENGSTISREALVPFFDMFNHDLSANKTRIYVKKSALCVFSGNHYKKGEQVFICYGNHDNEFLWSEYGFVGDMNSNSFDFYLLDNYFEKFVVKYKDDIAVEDFQDLVVTLDGSNWRLLNLCRSLVAVSSRKNKKKLIEEVEDIKLGRTESFKDRGNEVETYKFLEAVLNKALNDLNNKISAHSIIQHLQSKHVLILKYAIADIAKLQANN